MMEASAVMCRPAYSRPSRRPADIETSHARFVHAGTLKMRPEDAPNRARWIGRKVTDSPLGKQTLCQLSYSRSGGRHSSGGARSAQRSRTRAQAVAFRDPYRRDRALFALPRPGQSPTGQPGLGSRARCLPDHRRWRGTGRQRPRRRRRRDRRGRSAGDRRRRERRRR